MYTVLKVTLFSFPLAPVNFLSQMMIQCFIPIRYRKRTSFLLFRHRVLLVPQVLRAHRASGEGARRAAEADHGGLPGHGHIAAGESRAQGQTPPVGERPGSVAGKTKENLILVISVIKYFFFHFCCCCFHLYSI